MVQSLLMLVVVCFNVVADIAVVVVVSDIVSQTAVSYYSQPGVNHKAHHPTMGMDGDRNTCFISGYHSAPWWQVTFQSEHVIRAVDIYGMLYKPCAIPVSLNFQIGVRQFDNSIVNMPQCHPRNKTTPEIRPPR